MTSRLGSGRLLSPDPPHGPHLLGRSEGDHTVRALLCSEAGCCPKGATARIFPGPQGDTRPTKHGMTVTRGLEADKCHGQKWRRVKAVRGGMSGRHQGGLHEEVTTELRTGGEEGSCGATGGRAGGTACAKALRQGCGWCWRDSEEARVLEQRERGAD